MFTKEELEKTFNQQINTYSNNIEDIVFDLDLEKLGVFNSTKFSRFSTFVLGITGLLTLLITADGGLLEYHMKVHTLSELERAITHLDEWEDDWN